MSWKHSEEVTFHEVSAYFSEEEWKHLHLWQKELYRNVMKEIHQALISLGPLIATTVCSLRAKEKEEMCIVDNQSSPERRRSSSYSPSDGMSDHEVLLKRNDEESLHLMYPQDSEGFPYPQSDISLNKEEPEAIFIDHFGAEIRESSTNTSSGYEVVSFSIKEEKEMYCNNHQDRKRMDSTSSPTGNRSMNRKMKVGDSMKCSEKTTPCKVFSGKINTVVLQSSNQKDNSRNQMWPESYPELKDDITCESNLNNPINFNLHHGSSNFVNSDKYKECGSNLSSSQIHEDILHTQQNQRTYTFNEEDESHSLKEEFSSHTRTHSRERPYPCTECDRSFFQKSHLITHRRIHSGEKPYICTFCHKRFHRKDYLDGHIRIHTGERPYQCTKCDKSFIRKSDLNDHQRKHTPNTTV